MISKLIFIVKYGFPMQEQLQYTRGTKGLSNFSKSLGKWVFVGLLFKRLCQLLCAQWCRYLQISVMAL